MITVFKVVGQDATLKETKQIEQILTGDTVKINQGNYCVVSIDRNYDSGVITVFLI